MKKIISLLVAAAALFVLASCKSGEFTQDDANAAFANVYGRYATRLDLTDAKEVTVQPGNTLTQISVENMGEGRGYYFPVIMLASYETTVSDPDLIMPGMKLRVPNLEKNLNNPVSKSALKSFFKDVAKIYRQKDNATVEKALLEISNSL